MKLPFERSYWVEPGRLLGGWIPGDKTPSDRDFKLQRLLDCGVTQIINLMEEDERDRSGKPFEAYEPRFLELARERGISAKCARFPIKDLSVPHERDMNAILDAIGAALANHETVYVHCWGGRGRTGTVMGCHLRKTRNLSGQEALAALADMTRHNPKFGQVPEMPVQIAFVERWSL